MTVGGNTQTALAVVIVIAVFFLGYVAVTTIAHGMEVQANQDAFIICLNSNLPNTYGDSDQQWDYAMSVCKKRFEGKVMK